MRSKILLVLFLLGGLFFLASPAWAVPTDKLVDLANTLGLPKYDSIGDFLKDFISLLLAAVFLIAVIFAMISGYRMVASAGNEETLEKAKAGLTWAVAGMAVVVLAWIIVVIVVNILNKGPAAV